MFLLRPLEKAPDIAPVPTNNAAELEQLPQYERDPVSFIVDGHSVKGLLQPYVTYLFGNYFFEGLYVGSFLPQCRCFFDIALRALVSLPGRQSSVFQ